MKFFLKEQCMLRRWVCHVILGRNSKQQLCYVQNARSVCYANIHRKFHCTIPCTFKNYKEIENEVAHERLEDITSYAESLIPHPLKYGSLREVTVVDHNSVFANFYDLTKQNIAEQQDLGGRRFSDISTDLSRSFSSATYDEIVHTLYCLCFWPYTSKSYEYNYKRVWNSLDYECTKRIKDWTISQKLLVADYWFHLRLSRITLYNLTMIKDLIYNKENLNVNQVVQLMFYINLQRNVPQSLMSIIEGSIETAVKTVSISELSVICLGYFKTETRILNQNILKSILIHSGENIETINSSEVIGILKCLRKSFQQHMVGYYSVFLKKCAVNVPKWDLLPAVHSALLSATAFVFEPFLLDNAIDKIEKQIHLSRLKDLNKLMQCLSLFNYLPDKKFNDLVLDELLKNNREEEILQYTPDAIQLPTFYAYMGYYRYDVLEKIMQPKIIDSDSHLDKYWFAFLDYCIEIECKDYNGPRLIKGQRNYVIDKRKDVPQNYNGIMKRTTESVFNSAKDLYGEKNVYVAHILPHIFIPNVIIRLNPKQNATALKDILDTFPPNEAIIPPANEKWIALVLCGPYSYAFNTNRPCGLAVLKQRQMTILGYKALLINFRHIPSDDSKRKTVLKQYVEKTEYS